MTNLSFSVKVINKAGFFVDKKRITDIVLSILDKEECNKFTARDIIIVFVGVNEIRRLNKEYRKKDSATDVLSFLYNDEDVLGEIIVCPEYILEDEKKKDMVHRAVVHGVLHILGYMHNNDEEEALMEQKTEEYLK